MVLFGRAALALGFGDIGTKFGATQDVDAILPTVEMSKIEADTQFWEAIEKTNKELEPTGLYLSHLFSDRQVALTSNWLEKIAEILSEHYKHLRLFRPSSLDLILTKMMRNDREDLGDIRFILEHEKIEPATLTSAFKNTRDLEIPELREIFLAMQPLVIRIAIAIETDRERGGVSEPAGYALNPDWWTELTKGISRERGLEKDRDLSL